MSTHSASFWLTVAAVVLTAGLIVAWNTIHIVLMVVDIALIVGVNRLCFWSGRNSARPPH